MSSVGKEWHAPQADNTDLGIDKGHHVGVEPGRACGLEHMGTEGGWQLFLQQ